MTEKPTGRLYDKAAWHKIRDAHLRKNPLCAHCLEVGLLTPAKEVDHVIPIAVGGAWFDPANFQSLCRSCHSVKTRSEQLGQPSRRLRGCDTNGLPLDPDHPWNRERGSGE